MLRTKLRTAIAHFHDDGSVFVEMTVAVYDDAHPELGSLDHRVISIDDLTLRAGVRAAAVALAPATESETGLPLDAIPPMPTS